MCLTSLTYHCYLLSTPTFYVKNIRKTNALHKGASAGIDLVSKPEPPNSETIAISHQALIKKITWLKQREIEKRDGELGISKSLRKDTFSYSNSILIYQIHYPCVSRFLSYLWIFVMTRRLCWQEIIETLWN